MPNKGNQQKAKEAIDKLVASTARQHVAQAAKATVRKIAVTENKTWATKEIERMDNASRAANQQPKTAEQYAKEAATRKAQQKGKQFVAQKVLLRGGRLLLRQAAGVATAMYELGTIDSMSPAEQAKYKRGPNGGYLPMEVAPKRMIWIDPHDPSFEYDPATGQEGRRAE